MGLTEKLRSQQLWVGVRICFLAFFGEGSWSKGGRRYVFWGGASGGRNGAQGGAPQMAGAVRPWRSWVGPGPVDLMPVIFEL